MGGLATMAVAVLVASGGSPPEPGLAADVARLAERRVLFGHQSVGADVTRGVERLAAQAGGALRVVELPAAAPIPRGTFAHVLVDRNGDTDGKLRSFEQALASFPGGPPDLALLKFCWADVDAGTDVERLFARYRATLDGLAARYPATTFVHVTIPLTTVQAGPRAVVKRLLGRAPFGALENARREAYNDRLREVYAGRAPVFDLARAEATLPDGSVATAEWAGRTTLQLAAGYTEDGGHLTPAAQDRVARALLAVLARAPAR
jgi:lysophospholipase L1-like esterase